MGSSISLPARLGAFYFAYFAYTAAYVAYFPLYLASRDLDAAGIALVLSLPQAARIFAPGAWGWLADRFGAQRAVVVGSACVMLVGLAALTHVQGLALIALVVGIVGVFSAGALPLVEATTLAFLAGRHGGYGPIRLWGSVGFIAIVLAGGAWLDVGPVSVVPGAMALMAAGVLAVAVGLPKGSAHAAAPRLKLSLSAGARAVLGGGFCMAFAHGALYAFFTLHLQRSGYSGRAIGALWTLGVLAEIVVFACLPAIFRRYAISSLLLASCACAGLRFFAIAWLAALPAVLVVAQLLHAATFGAFHAASVAAIQRVFPEGTQARGQAFFSSVSYGAGGAAGALVAGWAWQSSGPGLTFSLAGLAGLAGAYFANSLRRAGL